ncbi:unnamed protein product [Gadus morhua 'NCC']
MAEGTTNRNEVKILKILDILDKDVFKGEIIDPDIARHTEVNFYRVYTTVGDEEIELDVDPAKQLALWESGTVTFELGFTIRAPTAYNIQITEERCSPLISQISRLTMET